MNMRLQELMFLFCFVACHYFGKANVILIFTDESIPRSLKALNTFQLCIKCLFFLAVTVTSRPDCYWGRNCRTQVKAHHAM
ncbi:hypothetical protein JD844_015101 [Phrynosoma platyrhinos]|uniref:Secreted protein n=1 Tax=Phrynosoma platyrhinos TaxID=52577 RepID=A0ABQ7T7X4_PHRPL|nr:hypothetical protein JD844_015101 [Phrynosoma platyrhinos]